MELTFTPTEIKELIKQSKLAIPYEENEGMILDNMDNEELNRVKTTTAQKILKEYFKTHLEDSIENYL